MNMQAHALMDTHSRPPVPMVAGAGAWLIDQQGQRYLDFVQGWAVNCLGHSPAIVQQALITQAASLINCSPSYLNTPMLELAEALTRLSGLDKVFFTNSGAEANEGAIKLARKWGELHKRGACEIITLEHSFHGRTLATMSASGKSGWEQLFEPKVPGFSKVPINDIEALRDAISDRTVAVMLEPVQGEAGVIPANDDYLRAVRALTHEHDVLLILDEVQTGMGRTGTLFAFEHAGIKPDILTLGKGLGGGVPLAAMLATEAVSCFAHGDQGGTFSGTPLMSAVGLAVVRELSKPEFLANVVAMGNYLGECLQALAQEFRLGSIRRKGLLAAVDIPAGNAISIASQAFEEGLIINATRPTILRFMPALNVTCEEIDEMHVRLRTCMKSVTRP